MTMDLADSWSGLSLGQDGLPDGPASSRESDTCRICRGEGSGSEPLFYPCRCSGSIKHVHQECLMEWLSHSQKKYCELCKTPFRFTKRKSPRHSVSLIGACLTRCLTVYHPLMPGRLPTPIFLRHLFNHTVANLVTWSRFLLVAFVWLGLLPLAMRQVWRFIFWVADGGWAVSVRDMPHPGQSAETEARRLLDMLQQYVGLDASRALSLPSINAPPVVRPGPRTFISGYLSDANQLTYFTRLFDNPNVAPETRKAFKTLQAMLVRAFLANTLRSPARADGTNDTDHWASTGRPKEDPTFLSRFATLDNLTVSPIFNRLVIDILEGQLITLAVMVAFILIFLIREWVVQQRPELQMGGEFNAAFAAAPGEPELPEQHENVAPELPPQAEEAAEWPDGAERERADWHLAETERFPEANPFRDRDDFDHSFGEPSQQQLFHPPSLDADERYPEYRIDRRQELKKSLQRPPLPDREAISKAAVIRRLMEEGGNALTDKFGREKWQLEMYLDIYLRAEKDPHAVLRLIEAENRTEDLRWIVDLLNRRIAKQASATAVPFPRDPQSDNQRNELIQMATSRADEFDTSLIPLRGMESAGSEPPYDRAWRSRIEEPGTWESEWEVSRTDLVPIGDHSTADAKGKAKLDIADEEDHPGHGATNWTHDSTATGMDELEIVGESLHHRKDPAHVLKPSSSSTLSDGLPSDHHLARGSQSRQASSTDSAPGSANHVDTDNVSNGGGQLEGGPTGQADDETDETAPVEANQPPAPPENMVQPGLHERAIAWLWGDIVPGPAAEIEGQADDERVVGDIADEAPFVPVNQADVAGPANDAEAVDDAANAAPVEAIPNDPDAVEDGEDFDGLMELIGMRGPLTGLVQNVIFSAVLISGTVVGGIWLPYIWGKLVLLLAAHPITLFVGFPVDCCVVIANLLTDVLLFVLGSVIHWTDQIIRASLTPLAQSLPFLGTYTHSTVITDLSRSVAERGMDRMARVIVTTSLRFFETDYPIFSVLCHQSLQRLKSLVTEELLKLPVTAKAIYAGILVMSTPSLWWMTLVSALSKFPTSKEIWRFIMWPLPVLVGTNLTAEPARAGNTTTSWMVSNASTTAFVDRSSRTTPLDLDLAYWGTGDRIIAIIAGYTLFALIGALYVRRGRPYATTEQGQRIEILLSEALRQAGGVLKVVLIISIEMIAFPLYCGLLLDLALLPLFEQTSILSRVHFSMSSPWTSAFVHWFIGTCYMFHFALFVSMCRKIMRKGVLYFIRDPDDPTFHPVRDVLERNVVAQLRKITFSALVYGGLIIFCLGGVVWGLDSGFQEVLPIHWSSNEPVLNFPVDLLFYNFLTPLAIVFFKPSDGLHAMYTWWFRKCARQLRLSWFLFGERHKDEEGRHVRRSWWDALAGRLGDCEKPVIGEDRRVLAEDRNVDVYFLRDGRYVRSPASDQVRIPKGGRVFHEIEESEVADDVAPGPEPGPGPRPADARLFETFYIPPWFRARIALFILCIWLFAALTGVGITILPLVIGRRVFATVFADHVRMNDVYAFSIGVYLVGGVLYLAFRYDLALAWMQRSLSLAPEPRREAAGKAKRVAIRAIRLIYTYAAFGLVLPTLLALVMEFYIIIPLHTALAPDQKHIIHFIQDWTLGVLYVKLAGRLILWHADARLGAALRAVVRQGWTNPDVQLATRAFILPVGVVMIGALVAPLPLGWVANQTYYARAPARVQRQVYRYSYPAVLCTVGCSMLISLLRAVMERWRRVIKDEVYLIGERLHNFGERKTSATVVASAEVGP